ncbi:MAG: hypothetical protein OEW64_09815 [Gammaproteobacteria bacterium]|nr:hypothetical protein [Gammaproteobacteria bacterium]MDH5304380.1 hypothetical protein [Gammaproteobacteria bacterium]MDH5320960.1 hypothetical protein [Gammaproteobacteria bacterium]
MTTIAARKLSVLAALLSGALLAADYQPYEDARITVEQWQAYFDTVLLEFADTMQEEADVNLVLFHDESTSTYFAFTTTANPAHPAWVTRRVIEQDGEIAVEQIGYFAGDEASFADLFDAISDLSAEMQKEFQRE